MFILINSEVVCNKCGKLLSYQDISDGNYHFNFDLGNASHHDGENISFDLCGKCLDKILNTTIKSFKHVPEGFMQDDNFPLTLEEHQKVFEHWKETGDWYNLMFYTYEQLVELNGYLTTDYLNEIIKKYHPDMPLLTDIY
jgi:hypothetical protein